MTPPPAVAMQNSNQGSNKDKGITHNNQVYLIHNYYAPYAGNPNEIRIVREDEIVKKMDSDSVPIDNMIIQEEQQ